MAKRKRNKHIILIIIGIVVLLLVLNWFGVFDGIKKGMGFNIITTTSPWQEVGNYPPYTCSSPDGCNVKGYVECTTPSQALTVKFRTNVINNNFQATGSDGNQPWIAYDTGNGVLTNFIYTSNPVDSPNKFSPYYPLNKGSIDADLFYNVADGGLYITKHEPVADAFSVPTGNRICSGGGGNCNTRTTICNVCDRNCIFAGYSQTDDCGPEMHLVSGEQYYKFTQSTNTVHTNPSTSQTCGSMACTEQYGDTTNRFNCPAIITTFKADGTEKNRDSVGYPDVGGSGVNPGNSTAKSYFISNNEKAQVIYQGSPGIMHLFAQTITSQTSCGPNNVPLCSDDRLSAFPCINDVNGYHADLSNPTFCTDGKLCVDSTGNCTFPINTDIYFVKRMETTRKPGFTQTDLITVKAKITSSTISSGTVVLKLYKQGVSSPIANVQFPFIFTSGTPKDWDISTPNIEGLYYVTADISYIDSNGQTVNVPTIGGDGSNPLYKFRIGSSIGCGINVAGHSQQSLFINQPIEVKIIAQSPSGAIIDHLDNYPNLVLKFNGNILPINPSGWGTPIQSGSNLNYIYNLTLTTPGTLDASATISLNNIQSDLCSLNNLGVSSNVINAKFTDMPGCIAPSTKTIHFTTQDSAQNYVDVINDLEATDANGVTSPITDINHDDLGKYSFDYNFASPSGGEVSYSFKLVSSANGLVSNQPITGIVDVRGSCTGECSSDSYCGNKYGVGYTCDTNGKCNPPPKPFPLWVIVVIISGIAMAVIIIIVVISIKRRPKQQVYTGFDGGIAGL